MKKTTIVSAVIFCLVVIFTLVGLGHYPQREITQSKGILIISKPTRDYIDDVVKKSDIITGLQIVTIDLKRNTRTETYMSIDNPFLQGLYDRYVANKVIETPVFTEDKVNNSRILRFIDGEFVCVPYREATAYRYAPQAEAVISTVCGLAIPPQHYGEFAGLLTLYLVRDPSIGDKEMLFLFSRDLAVKIADQNNLHHDPQ